MDLALATSQWVPSAMRQVASESISSAGARGDSQASATVRIAGSTASGAEGATVSTTARVGGRLAQAASSKAAHRAPAKGRIGIRELCGMARATGGR